MAEDNSPSPQDAPITLSVKTLESQTHAVSLPPSETVLQLKERLAAMLEVPSPRQRLIFRGRVLADDKALTEYSLQDGHTIHLVTRPADAPSNSQNDAPRTRSGPSTGGVRAPFQFEAGDYHLSIIGMDEIADPQRIMQAITGGLPMDMGGAPAVIHFGGDPEALRSLFSRGSANVSTTTPEVARRASGVRVMTSAAQSVPLGAGLPHLATIDAELTRALAQLRNVQTILAHPADRLDEVQLESLEVTGTEPSTRNDDGDSTAIARMGNMLTVLSNASQTMADHLQALSGQYTQDIGGPSDRVALQLESVRAARAMYRLASVQNTIFPMLANASFVGTSPETVAYRFQPAQRVDPPAVEIPLPPSTLANLLARAPAQVGGTVIPGFPFSTLARSGAGAPVGLIPSLMAHARAQAQAVNQARAQARAQTQTSGAASTGTSAADSTSSSTASSPIAGSGPIGHLILGPNGNLSYSRDIRASRPTTRPTQAATSASTSSRAAETTEANSAQEPSSTSSQSRRRERPDDFAEEDRSAARRRLQDWMGADSLAASSGGSVARSTPSSRPAVSRSPSNDTRRQQSSANNANDSVSNASSPSPSSPSLPASSSTNNGSAAASPAYNLGRIGVFISAILRMVDQPREDGSPRTLADVICNDPQENNTPLQDLVRDVAESLTVRETRSVVEGHPAPLRNIHPVLNSFIRNRALNGQQIMESNLEAVAIMFSHGIMNAVPVDEILETLTPPATIQISSEDIRRISIDVLREHFRRLIYLVVAAPAGRESSWPTFARDLILWMRDVVGAWRLGFYGLFQERDQAEAQRIATHVVGSAIHANGRRWVELSNRATNTLVNVLCANIVPRRRGEEQTGGLVGGAWPLMATAPRPPSNRSQTCMAPSLLGSTAPPAPLGPSTSSSSGSSSSSYGAFGVLFGGSSSGASSSGASTSTHPTSTTERVAAASRTTTTAAAPATTSQPNASGNGNSASNSESISETLSENLERMIRESVGPLPGVHNVSLDFNTMDDSMRRALRDSFYAGSRTAPSEPTRNSANGASAFTVPGLTREHLLNPGTMGEEMHRAVLDAFYSYRPPASSGSTTGSPATSTAAGASSATATATTATPATSTSSTSSTSPSSNNHRTRVEEVEDEEMS
ncbi:hypothetical protein EMPS_11514 [Entomortierella parvispora]|uniref:Ubiquitin-like domain-containing protein n=1 Tax=Entomortierella parvispora TaxID=205924 RepID=A0A9P3HLW0_9FUNG|nr:hypothetical protein EMPS_11514 [Entomortierella parvispora]